MWLTAFTARSTPDSETRGDSRNQSSHKCAVHATAAHVNAVTNFMQLHDSSKYGSGNHGHAIYATTRFTQLLQQRFERGWVRAGGWGCGKFNANSNPQPSTLQPCELNISFTLPHDPSCTNLRVPASQIGVFQLQVPRFQLHELTSKLLPPRMSKQCRLNAASSPRFTSTDCHFFSKQSAAAESPKA